jgi:hypothetical protein
VGKPIRWLAMTDTHGDKADTGTVEAALEFSKWWKPTIRAHMGDAFDFRWLRRSASDEEKAAGVEADFDSGLDLLKRFNPTQFLWGNHDVRLVDCMDSTSGALRQLACAWLDRIDLTLKRAKQYPYDKRKGVMPLGDYSLVHGYSHGVGALRKTALTYGNVLMGHVHRNDMVTVERHRPAVGYSVGCACALDMDYNRAALGTLAQSHGWAYGLLYPNGEVLVWQARKVAGRWVLPSEMREIPEASSKPPSRRSRPPAHATRGGATKKSARSPASARST